MVTHPPAWLAEIAAQCDATSARSSWVNFLVTLQGLQAELNTQQLIIGGAHVRFPDPAPPDFAAHLESAAALWAEKGKLSMWRGHERRAASLCRINGSPPQSQSDMQVVHAAWRAQALRTALAGQWNTRVSGVGGPSADPSNAEVTFTRWLAELQTAVVGSST